MIIDTNQEISPTQKIIKEIDVWRKDAKRLSQTATYDFLSDIRSHIKAQEKALNGKTVSQGFTRTNADIAFSDYIRQRANYCCEKCGKQYSPKDNGLQCSHHFSRRYYNIRYDPDNAVALCYHCHVYWYQKDIPESARWLENKLGKAKIDRLIELKNRPQVKHSQSELDMIAKQFKEKSNEISTTQ